MKISVVIPHYGDEGPTQALVAMLRRQAGAPALQIIVVDDASPVPYAGDADLVVRREVNGGFGSAVNAGAARADGPYLLVLNSDVTMSDSFVQEFASGAHPWMPAVVAPQVSEERGRRCVGHPWPTALGVTVEMLDPLVRHHGRPWFEKIKGNDPRTVAPAEPVITDWATGVCLLMPLADFRAVGGFDEAFYMNCEEVDLQRRLAVRGVPTVVLPAPVLQHVGGGSSDPMRRQGWLFDSRMRYQEKWGRAAPLYLSWRLAAVANLVWNTVRERAGRDIDARARYVEQRQIIRHAWRNRR